MLSRMTGIVLLILLVGCASPRPQPPTTSLSEAEQAIEAARAADAAEFATLEMQMAEEKLQQARSILQADQEGQLARSRRLAEQAALDARLASLRAEVARLQEMRRDLAQSIEILQGGAP